MNKTLLSSLSSSHQIPCLLSLFVVTIALGCTDENPSENLLADESIREAGPPTGNYILEWHDEFEGTELNTSKWAYREDNKHRSIQRRENVSIVDGVLRLDLRVLNKPIEGKTASGAGIVSNQRFRYGYYEVRARLGNGTGAERGWHHSFWAMAAELHHDTVSNTFPGIRRTGIDGFENPTEHRFEPDLNTLNNFVQHAVVWDEQGTESDRLPKPPQNRTLIPGFDASEWHTYAFEWTPERVRFYVDDQVTQIAEYPADEHIHDAINVWLTAISANWNDPGDPIPSKAEYDYFRFYKAKEWLRQRLHQSDFPHIL